jgi:sugar lactone lactonase YvrE
VIKVAKTLPAKAGTPYRLTRSIKPRSIMKSLLAKCISLGLLWWATDLAGAQSFKFTTLSGNAGYGSVDGPGANARFDFPTGVAVDASGAIYIADTQNSTIRRIDTSGNVQTFAGSPGIVGATNGIGTAAHFKYPQGIATDPAGNIYVADTGNSIIRKITAAGEVTTIAGSPGVVGSSNGVNSAASFNLPCGLALDASGNLYVADSITILSQPTLSLLSCKQGRRVTVSPESSPVDSNCGIRPLLGHRKAFFTAKRVERRRGSMSPGPLACNGPVESSGLLAGEPTSLGGEARPLFAPSHSQKPATKKVAYCRCPFYGPQGSSAALEERAQWRKRTGPHSHRSRKACNNRAAPDCPLRGLAL